MTIYEKNPGILWGFCTQHTYNPSQFPANLFVNLTRSLKSIIKCQRSDIVQ